MAIIGAHDVLPLAGLHRPEICGIPFFGARRGHDVGLRERLTRTDVQIKTFIARDGFTHDAI